MRNQVMKHAFENLPQSVLGTSLGRVIFSALQRQAAPQRNHKGRGKK